MKMIDNILITELGFKTTTHNRCICIQVRDGEIQLLLRQVDNFMLRITSKKAVKDLFNGIGIKIRFPSEAEANIIPLEFLDVVKDYIKMSSKSYID